LLKVTVFESFLTDKLRARRADPAGEF
jgi:hypothetical protein